MMQRPWARIQSLGVAAVRQACESVDEQPPWVSTPHRPRVIKREGVSIVMTTHNAPLEGLQLVHTGLVCQDIESAKHRLSSTLNLHWVGVEREDWSLIMFGKPVNIPLRIAHASNGQANFELIEAVPDTPWVTSEDLIQHHMCFHSSDSEAVCKQFEARGFERVLGAPGDPQGYFQDPAGLLIEIIGDGLLAYLQDFYQQSLTTRQENGAGYDSA
jgi:catechol 2,3-dioxygenase-like lactoylglutathione lyase family enzyme